MLLWLKRHRRQSLLMSESQHIYTAHMTVLESEDMGFLLSLTFSDNCRTSQLKQFYHSYKTLCVCVCCVSSSLLFLSVQRPSVWGNRRFDALPSTWGPDDVRGPTVKQPHRHLGHKPELWVRNEDSERADVKGSVRIIYYILLLCPLQATRCNLLYVRCETSFSLYEKDVAVFSVEQ